MVVRFVCAVRVPLCVRVSRVCPGSPRCLVTGLVTGTEAHRSQCDATCNAAFGLVQDSPTGMPALSGTETAIVRLATRVCTS